MSSVKFEDLSPVPFFARFLEGQSIKEMTREELKAVCGGTAVTMAAPSDQEGVPSGNYPEAIGEIIRRALEGIPSSPGVPGPAESPIVTMAYPSDGEAAVEPF
jgi:hypothetical protein